MFINIFFDHEACLEEFMSSSERMTYVRAISEEEASEQDIEESAVIQSSQIIESIELVKLQ